ncbi:MAG: zinc metalloprotease HtpX [Sporolactobacillus sp.]
MLYEQIQQNKRKTVLLLILFSVLIGVIGWATGYFFDIGAIGGAVLAIIVLAIYLPITFASAGAQVLSMSGARKLEKSDNPMLFNLVEELALAAAVPMPAIYIVSDPAPNAFATGLSPKKSAIAFTTGLLDRLNREEIAGVAAHEFSHIRNYDIRLMTLCIALVSVIVIIADMGQRALFWGGGRKRDNQKNPVLLIGSLAVLILAPLAAQFVHLAVSRNREYLADASAVELTRDPQGLIGALRKISADTHTVKAAKEATASMYLANPFGNGRKRRASLFDTHPPIERRIERLEAM